MPDLQKRVEFVGRIVIQTAEEWHKARAIQGIGGSEAASIINLNPYKSNLELWEEKVGIRQCEDISDKPAVKYGKEAEQHIRALFALDFPQYSVEYHEFDILFNDEFPFIFATLDGELTDTSNRKGVLEVKTTEIQRSTQWAEWDNKVPDHYYVQVLHQLIATGYEFTELVAHIKYHKGEELRTMVKHYHWERSELLDDMQMLIKSEESFWKSLQEKKRPALQLPQI